MADRSARNRSSFHPTHTIIVNYIAPANSSSISWTTACPPKPNYTRSLIQFGGAFDRKRTTRLSGRSREWHGRLESRLFIPIASFFFFFFCSRLLRAHEVSQFEFIPPGSGNSARELSVGWLFLYLIPRGLRPPTSSRNRDILRDTIVGAYRTGLGARTRSDRLVVFRASNCRPREAWEVLQVPRLRGVMAITRAADTASCRPFGALRPLGSFRRSLGAARRRSSSAESRRRAVREMNSQMNSVDLA